MKALLALFVLCNIASAREFNNERPDKARLAYTVDEKKLAFEPELINYSTQKENDKSAISSEFFFRYGVSANAELQLVTTPYKKESYKESGKRERESGFGRTEFALKRNILGNDDGDVALAIIPYLYTEDRVEGGLAFAMDSFIYNSYYFSVTLEGNNIRRDLDLEWQSNFSGAVSMGREAFTDTYFYLELFNESGLNKEQGNITTFDLAVQFEINPTFRVDVGTFIGLSPEADDLQTFAGAAFLIN